MMDSETAAQDKILNDSQTTPQKTKCLSNGTNDQDGTEHNPAEKQSSANIQENGMTCNGAAEMEGVTDSDENLGDHQQNCTSSVSDVSDEAKKSAEDVDSFERAYENTVASMRGKLPPKKMLKLIHNNMKSKSGTKTSTQHDVTDEGDRNHQNDCDINENSALQTTTSDKAGDGHSLCDVKEGSIAKVKEEANKESVSVTPSEMDGHTSDKIDKSGMPVEEMETLTPKQEPDNQPKEDNKNLKKSSDALDKKNLRSSSNDRATKDNEKENKEKIEVIVYPKVEDAEGKGSKSYSPKQKLQQKDDEKQSKSSDLASDDIEIIGESKIAKAKPNKNTSVVSQNAPFITAGNSAAGSPMLTGVANSGIVPSSAMLNSPAVPNPGLSSAAKLYGTTPGLTTPHGMPPFSPGYVFPGSVGQGSQGMPTLVPTVAPPKPKSSLDQIELIRWEIQNRINTRPKYFKPNPTSELGPLAKFLFDIGSDLIKESVYHDLVKIQSKKNGDDKLTAKEKEDLEKLKDIEKDLFATIGHLKLKLKQRCKVCHFQTESFNVMVNHKQFPHEDNKFLKCAHCSFSTRQVMAFKFHMEAEHAIQAKLHDKKAFFECDLCPYENNQEQKLALHKQRCVKQFRPLFNLHPSCLSGAEINLCLENIFYRPVIPKNLKILQQKHAQQQAALAEARRQQAQVQALAAQKNAAAIATKKQQQMQMQKRLPAPITPQYSNPTAGRSFPTRMPGQQPPLRYNASSNSKGPRPTVANMLNNKQSPMALPSGPAPTTAAGGFEVCEICGGYVKDRKALRIHFFYAHRIDLPFNLFERNQAPLYCATCYVRFWTAQGLRKHIDTHKEENQTRGVVGKCISCGHHVLNLLLHMRVVHNREMQHYVNALMCMFCGGHFSSRQECEQHILKVHGHVDPVTGTLKSTPTAPVQPPPLKSAPAQKKQTSNSLVKGSVCVLCNLNFGRNVDLTRHCMRMHHTCMKCGMVVIDKASLMKHTCLSSPSGTRDCTMCGETGFHPAYYVKHLRDNHLKKFSIRVANLSKHTIEKWTKRQYPFEEDLVEISDSEEEVTAKKITLPPDTSKPRPRIGPACKIGRRRESSKIAETPDVEQKKSEKNDDDNKANVSEAKDAVKEDIKDKDGNEGVQPSESSKGQKRKSASDTPEPGKSKRKKSS